MKNTMEGGFNQSPRGPEDERRKEAIHSLRVALKPDASHYAGYNVTDFIDERKNQVEAGVLTEEEANKAVLDIAKTELYEAGRGVQVDSSDREALKKGWLESGILTEQEIDTLLADGAKHKEAYND